MRIARLTDYELDIWKKVTGGKTSYTDFVKSLTKGLECYDVGIQCIEGIYSDVEFNVKVMVRLGESFNKRKGRFEVNLYKEKTGLCIVEPFDVGVLPKKMGKTTGTRLMGNIIRSAKEIGLEKAVIHAQEVGPYAWAVMGFYPDKIQWRAVFQKIKGRYEDGYKEELERIITRGGEQAEKAKAAVELIEKLDIDGNPQQIWAVAELAVILPPNQASLEEEFANSRGDKFGKLCLLNNDWAGEFDVRDGSPSMQKLTAYEIKKGVTRDER